MVLPEENKLVETFHGFIENSKDGLILFQAVKDGLLPSVQRRFTVEQRMQIKSGSIFIFNETESNIKRWTDGRNWTPSRVLGDFLVYRELEKNIERAKRDKKIVKRNISLKALDAKKALSSRFEALNIPNFRQDRFFIKVDGLVKKTMSVIIKEQTYHMISYYKESEVIDNLLTTPSEDKSLQKVVISDELLKQMKQPTQITSGIEEINQISITNTASSTDSNINDSTNESVNTTSKIKKQPYMNIAASVDNTVDINDLNMDKKITKNDDKKSIKNESPNTNIEEMISQIDENMHFLQISHHDPHLLDHLHMDSELLNHVSNIFNDETSNDTSNNSNNENHSNFNSITTSSEHPLLNEITTDHSILDDHHYDLNIETLYHQLDDQLHNESNNDLKVHPDDELLNLFMQLAEKSHLEDNNISIKNNSDVKSENDTNHELIHHIDHEMLSHLDVNPHDFQELLIPGKNISSTHHQDTTTLESLDTHEDINQQELLEYLAHFNEQQEKLSNTQHVDTPLHLNATSSEAVKASTSASIQTTLSPTIHTDELHHPVHYDKDIKSVIISAQQKHEHEHELNEKLTTEQSHENSIHEILNHHSSNHNPQSEQSERLIENNMNHILQLLNSNKEFDMETLQSLLQLANHEQNYELAHYLEAIIHMLNIEQHQYQQQHNSNEHQLLNDHSLTDVHHNTTPIYHDHDYDILHNYELFNQNLLNFMHMDNLHPVLENHPTENNVYTNLHTSSTITHSVVTHIDPSHSLPVTHINSAHSIPVTHIDPTHSIHVTHIDTVHSIPVTHIEPFHSLPISHIGPAHSIPVSHIDATHSIPVTHIDTVHSIPVTHIDTVHSIPVSHIDTTHSIPVTHIDAVHSIPVTNMDTVHSIPVTHMDTNNNLQTTTNMNTMTSFTIPHYLNTLTNETVAPTIQQHPSLAHPIHFYDQNVLTTTKLDDHMDYDHHNSSHQSSDHMDHDHSHNHHSLTHQSSDHMDQDHNHNHHSLTQQSDDHMDQDHSHNHHSLTKQSADHMDQDHSHDQNHHDPMDHDHPIVTTSLAFKNQYIYISK